MYTAYKSVTYHQKWPHSQIIIDCTYIDTYSGSGSSIDIQFNLCSGASMSLTLPSILIDLTCIDAYSGKGYRGLNTTSKSLTLPSEIVT